MVSEYGTEHEELDLNPEQDLEGAIQEFAYYSDEPSADAGALPLWFLAKLSRHIAPRSRSAVKAPTNCSAVTLPIAPAA